mmetsp:Transcript_32029/g.95549  ORF Transcript_32029/g.95549 Transcript_32029/m.95549 type:complete len:392 (-) Transcript_32029:1501-2676(-)
MCFRLAGRYFMCLLRTRGGRAWAGVGLRNTTPAFLVFRLVAGLYSVNTLETVSEKNYARYAPARAPTAHGRRSAAAASAQARESPHIPPHSRSCGLRRPPPPHTHTTHAVHAGNNGHSHISTGRARRLHVASRLPRRRHLLPALPLPMRRALLQRGLRLLLLVRVVHLLVAAVLVPREAKAAPQRVRHELWRLVLRHVLEGGDKDGVDADVEAHHESVRDEVRYNKHRDRAVDWLVLGGVLGLRLEEEEGGEAAADGRRQPNEQPEQLLHHLVDGDLAGIGGNQAKGLARRAAKRRAADGDVDKGKVRDELDGLLEAVQAAERALHHVLEEVRVGLPLLGDRVERVHHDLQHLHDGDDAGSKGGRADVLAQHGEERREEQRGARAGAAARG